MSEERVPKPSAKTSRSPLRNYLLLLITGFALVVSWDAIGFFLFLMILGGVLSYLGDQLGSYCGKNRLSIFGLRPKYTAGLINLCTGLLITAITFGGSIYVSEDVRAAVFSVSDLRQQAASLRVQEAKVRSDLAGVRQELSDARTSFDAARRERGVLAAERDTLVTERDALISARAALEEQTLTLESQKRVLAQDNDSLAGRNIELVSSTQELEARRAVLNENIAGKRQEIDRLNLALEKKETAPVVISRGQVLLEDTSAIPMDVSTTALEDVVRDLAERVAARVQLLDVEFGDFSKEHLVRGGVPIVQNRIRETVAFYRRIVAEGRAEADQVPVECHVVPVSTRNVSVGERLVRIALEVWPNRLIFGAGEEVARTVVDGANPPDKVLDQLLYFDQQVRSVLREKGVSASVLARGPAAGDPKRLFELVRLAESVHQTRASQVVLCRASEVVYAFQRPTLEYRLEATTLPGQGTVEGESPGPAQLALETPDLGEMGFELVLPEPTLSADTLMPTVKPTLEALAPPTADVRPEGSR